MMPIKKNIEKGIINIFMNMYNTKHNAELSLKELNDKPDVICYCDKLKAKMIGVEIVELLRNPSNKMGEQRAMERQYISALQKTVKEILREVKIICDVEIKYPFPSQRNIKIKEEINVFKKYLREIKKELLNKKIYNRKTKIGNHISIHRMAVRENQNLDSVFYKNNIIKDNDDYSLWRCEINKIIENKKRKALGYNSEYPEIYLLIRSTWEIDNIKESYNKEEFGIDSLAPFCAVWILHFPVNMIDIEYKISIMQ